MRFIAVALLGLAVGCGPGSDAEEPDAAPNRPDSGNNNTPDASNPGGPDAPDLGPPTHLLITEVTLTPSDGEFVEIYNPGTTPVDLTDYYLSDDHEYALLPGLTGNTAEPALSQTDFIAKFPDGAVIGPGEVQTIAIDAAGFMMTYGAEATYGLTGGGQAMIPQGTFDETQVGLTNGGESVALFQWDGRIDLVSDIDLVQVGNPSASNLLTPKTEIAVDGPDLGIDTSSYRPDNLQLGVMAMSAGNGASHKRIALEDGQETQDGAGNGILGHDETSENLSMTWDQADFTMPTPGALAPDFMP